MQLKNSKNIKYQDTSHLKRVKDPRWHPLQRKYYETKQGKPIYLRDTAPINFDIGLLIKKINNINSFYLKNVKKFIFVKQEKLVEKKAQHKNGTIFVSNEIYDIDKCFSSILREVSCIFYNHNQDTILKKIKSDFFEKKVSFYYDIVIKTSKVPLCDFLYEERSKSFESYMKREDKETLKRTAEKHFLDKNSIFSIKDYFSDCFVGFHQKRKTKLKTTHKAVYKIIKDSPLQEKT